MTNDYLLLSIAKRGVGSREVKSQKLKVKKLDE